MSHLSRRGKVNPFIVMDVMSKAAEAEARGQHIIHMEVGQPSQATPRSICESVKLELDKGHIGYTVALGLPELRQKIADDYRNKYAIELDISQIAITNGSSSAFILAFLALFDVGDRVAIATPAYPAYKNILESLGLEVVFIETNEKTRWALTPEMLSKAHSEKPLKGVLVASPANPTGTMMTPQALKVLSEKADQLNIAFISDEIYHGMTFGEIEQSCALEFSKNAIVINSFSKYYCMTGWRVGWMIVPPHLSRQVERLAQNLFISAPYLSQIAGIAAFDAIEECEDIKAIYARNRDILLTGLNEAGFTDLLPVDGAFYIYADIAHLCNSSTDFAARMLDEAGVAATPGVDFDPQRGHKTIRFSFAGSNDEMREAVTRLKAWLRVF